ncbi:hypothetical protein SPBR_08547 [Sporothrix brasiliensis 5110]|uniref:Aminoglycoside phosphotransferase domain-containing protein n=1 Tax=Sporothrix brasiliensis 5110 TaxID=1398154 RepID=A0A0C2IIW5_9PEZI|nr:uncharacterized protein SPBR_08547 [Sporothrix brasiliensis 5110]KIH86935.1 hypothetical protein SPBR_08547 [Sporothrix brasiliensis 5110]
MTWLGEPEPPIDLEFEGIAPPEGVDLPKGDKLLGLCERGNPRGFIEYPAESPVFFIKHGLAVYWNEVLAQDMAYRELRKLGSSVRVPGILYACRTMQRAVIVMEYIQGKTVEQLLEECKDDEAEAERVRGIVVHCLNDLIRIPVAAGSRPAAIDGGRIRHDVFDCRQASRHYENVNQLEEHINYPLVKDLEREPMIFLQDDWFPANFMRDADGHPVAIDFSETSILPSSFAKFLLWDNRFGITIRGRVDIPVTEGVDNTMALLHISGLINMGAGSFARFGYRVAGGDRETQVRMNESIRTAASNAVDAEAGTTTVASIGSSST